MCLMIYSQMVVALVYVLSHISGDFESDLEEFAMGLEFDGLYLALAGIVGTPVLVGSVFIATAFKTGFPSRAYLALAPVGVKAMLPWIALMACYLVGTDVYMYVFEVTDSSAVEFMTRARETARYPVLLWTAIVICAPISEEIFFRGFLFRGFQSSRLGAWGAILFTAVLWAVIHIQYELYSILIIFGFGIILGLARLRTNSVITTLVLHALWNFAAMLMTELYY